MDTGFGETLGAEDNGGVKNTGKLSLADTPKKKLTGKGNAVVGGAILGLVRGSTSKLDSTEVKPSPGTLTKKTLKSTPKKDLEKPVEKAQMPSSTLSGLGKKIEKEEKAVKPKRQASDKAKARAQLVKKIMSEKGLNLPSASKYIKDNNLF
jgi:hypothetical protein